MQIFALIALLISLLNLCGGARILGVFPHHGLSHFMMFEPLMLELARKGHQVVVISKYPHKENVPNYEHVDVNNDAPQYTSNIPFTIFKRLPVSLREDLEALYMYLLETENILNTKNFRNFMNSNRKFDLMVTEAFNSRLFYALSYKFKVPMITLSSSVMMPWASYDIANPITPSYIPCIFSYQADKMNFFQKLENVYNVVVSVVAYETFFYRKDEELKKKYFGEDVPSLRDIANNVSLMVVNSHFTLNRPRPLIPKVIEVGGLFITQSKPIPQNIEKFINESKHGVVYFCMGSLLRGETFPPEKREAFLYAFSKIPQRVLWKWEGDVLPGKSDNIMISKWMPQRDILAHPNVKLFISHGGLLGTSEAVYEGVPVLGIPIFGDQRTNIKSLEANGAGELLDYNEISKEVVLEKIQRLLNDPKYKENAKLLSDRYRDRPMSPLDTAVYWTEYVIRHKGAPHLRTAAADMPWYQYLLLDVIAFIVAVLVAGLLIIYYTTKFILRAIYGLICGGGAKKGSSKSDKKKRN
ncbi:UDP-glycosyltransferase UGT5-like isoform X30 [Planococcus citri]|uniref:UDP-glycosyltransferase UGT5-like isoform X30 n=1 Tax=Planococcus citri TaxID=170843 RepID=UPI0031F80D41